MKRSHQAVRNTVASQGRLGSGIRSVAEDQGLGFIPLQDEEYDFIIGITSSKPAVQALIGLLDEKPIIERWSNGSDRTRKRSMMNQSTPENGYRLKKRKAFHQAVCDALEKRPWTSRTGWKMKGSSMKLVVSMEASSFTWHRDIFFSIWMFRELNLTAMIGASRDGEGIFQVCVISIFRVSAVSTVEEPKPCWKPQNS